MSSDDPTTKLPDDEAKYHTKPSITAVLERINTLEERLTARIDSAVAELRAEMQTGFRKIDVLNRELLSMKAEHDQFKERLDNIEQKPS
jgi:chromosome segregation ATPase